MGLHKELMNLHRKHDPQIKQHPQPDKLNHRKITPKIKIKSKGKPVIWWYGCVSDETIHLKEELQSEVLKKQKVVPVVLNYWDII